MLAEDTLRPHRLIGITRLWPAALVGALFLRLGGAGFSPTDEGTLQAHVWRVLHGQIPHRDFIFARPLGSAYLHVIDFLLPLPLVLAERFTGLIAYSVYSICLARLIYDRPVKRWSAVATLGAVICVLVDMHSALITSWYTTDGLVFAAIGAVLIRDGARTSERRASIGMLMLGLAPLMKQSFFLAPLLGLVHLASSVPRGTRLRTAIRASVAGGLPAGTYVAFLAIAGAAPSFFHQISAAHPVYGRSFVLALTLPQARSVVGPALLIFAGAFAAGSWRPSLRAPARITASSLLVAVPIFAHLSLGGIWGFYLWWAACITVALNTMRTGTLDREGIFVVALGWQVSLSWGYAGPHLVAGATLLYCLDRIWRPYEFAGRDRLFALVSALVVTAMFAHTFLLARDSAPQEEAPRRFQTASLSGIAPALRGVRTNPTTARYLSEAAACIRAHPARWTAILPDNAALYPILELRNPFPMDWMYPDEVDPYATTMVEAASRIDARGHYLVLFQTFSALKLGKMAALPTQDLHPLPFTYGSDLGRHILDHLRGSDVRCGPFVGRYSP